MSVKARNLEFHVRDQSSVQDNLRTDIDAVHLYNVAGGKPAFMLGSYLSYFSILNMKATCIPETSFGFRRITRCYIPEDTLLQLVLKFEQPYRPKYKIDPFEIKTISVALELEISATLRRNPATG
jgi:hypothetical protein